MGITMGEKVQRMREKMGWNRKELAERAGLHPSHIGLIERGGRTEVRPDTLEKLAEALKVEKMYLLTDDPVEYLKIRLAKRTEAERLQWLDMSSLERTAYLVGEATDKYGEDARSVIEDSELYIEVTREDRESSLATDDVLNSWHLVTGSLGPDAVDIISRYKNALLLANQHNLPEADLLRAMRFVLETKGIKTDV